MPPKLQIKEIANSDIPIKKLKMVRDKPIQGNENTPFKNFSFFFIIAGCSGSGKSTTFFTQLINKKGMFHKKFDKVILISPSLHTLPFEFDKSVETYDSFDMDILQSIIDEQLENSKNGSEDELLLVLDDCLAEIMAHPQSKTLSKLILNRSHAKISVVLTSQSFTKIPLFLRKNSSHILICKTENKRELLSIHEDAVSYPLKIWEKIVKFCFAEPYSFILLHGSQIYKNWNRLDIQVDD